MNHSGIWVVNPIHHRLYSETEAREAVDDPEDPDFIYIIGPLLVRSTNLSGGDDRRLTVNSGPGNATKMIGDCLSPRLTNPGQSSVHSDHSTDDSVSYLVGCNKRKSGRFQLRFFVGDEWRISE